MSVYLLYGSERFLIEEAREKLMKSTLNKQSAEFDIAVYDMNEIPIEYALEDAETIPFLADKRVVILKNPTFLTAGMKFPSLIEHNVKKLEQYLNNPSPYSIVIFEAPYDKLDERKKIVKLLKRTAKVFQTSPLHDNKMNDWISEECEKLHIAITEDAIHQLTLLVGNDLGKLKSELDKLALYVQSDDQVTVETVNLLVSRSLENNVFVLVDHVVYKRIDKAFQALYDLFEHKEEPIKIVALLARQFRIISQVIELGKRGYSQKQMASFLKLHPFAVQQAVRQSRQLCAEECFNMIQELTEADYLMKTGKFDKKLLLELVLTKVVNKKSDPQRK